MYYNFGADSTMLPSLIAIVLPGANFKPCVRCPNSDIIKKGEVPDAELLTKVSKWCSLAVGQLRAKLEKKNLEPSGLKWDLIEILIRAECVVPFLSKMSCLIRAL
jgi:hypothetical protein